MVAAPPANPAFAQLARSYERHLRAANESPATVSSYRPSLRQLGVLLAERGMPTEPAHIAREHVEGFVTHLSTTRKASTAGLRYRALRARFTWLVAEGEVERGPMERMKPPVEDEAPPDVLPPDAIDRLRAACTGRGAAARRDEATVRLLLGTGTRRSELAGLRVEDVDLDDQVAVVLGTGRRSRAVPVGTTTAVARDRSLRPRARHARAARPMLWPGHQGPLRPDGMRTMLARRAKTAGVGPVHPTGSGTPSPTNGWPPAAKRAT